MHTVSRYLCALLVAALAVPTIQAAQFTLRWQDNSTNELGFKIERATGAAGAFAEVGAVGAGVTEYVDAGLAPGTLYRYRVRAWNYRIGTEVQYSGYSNTAQGTTPSSEGNAAPGGPGDTLDLRWADRLVNISTRLPLAAGGTEPAIAGFVLASPARVLVRGVGPTLGTLRDEAGRILVPDAHPDLRVVLFSGPTQVGANDDWSGVPAIAQAAAQVGAFPLAGAGSKDAALLVSLPAGQYTVHLVGAAGAGGTALIEVYLVP